MNQTYAQVEANIESLRVTAERAYKVYDRAFRVLGANEEECNSAYYAWMEAQDAWQDAKFQRDMQAYEFAERIGTAGFMVRPNRARYI